MTPLSRPARSLLLLSCFFTAFPCAAQTDDTPAANPGRPTVANPATLPPVGYLQFEQGYLGSLHSPETSEQYGVNQVIKLAVHPRLMLTFGSQPFATSTVPTTPGTSRDAGAVQLGAQAILYSPHSTQPVSTNPTTASTHKSPVPTIAIGYQHTVYNGTAPDIDLGSASNSAILLLSGDVRGFHYDFNAAINEQDGDSNISSRTIHRAQFLQTLSVNHALFTPNVQLSVELYHSTQPLVDTTDNQHPTTRAHLFDILFAPSYQLRPNLVFDIGFSTGITNTSTRWQSFAGFTYLLPHRLWPERTHK